MKNKEQVGTHRHKVVEEWNVLVTALHKKEHKVTPIIITGGPGLGKTHFINALIEPQNEAGQTA